MHNIYTILILMMSFCIGANAQNVHPHPYASPFDFPLLLSANFGELRPNHFHGGLDIKTKGTVGHPVRCIAEGYIARILITHGGYGKALYVNHPDGTTSVYGHVQTFAPNIEKYVQAYQMAHESFNCDIYPDKGLLHFKKGAVIAYSGNEGSSGGPHLHLEIRRTATNEYLNPLPYFKHLIRDTKSPVASSIYVYPVRGKGVVNGSTHRLQLPAGTAGQRVEAWGNIYFGIRAKDFMNETTNFYGVYATALYVDGKEIFSLHTDSLCANENRMINSLLDYAELSRTRACIVRSCRDEANRLSLVNTSHERGVLHINEERDYHVEYLLEDMYGNSSSYQFIVRGKRQSVPSTTTDACYRNIYSGKANVIQGPGIEMLIPKHYIYADCELNLKIENPSDAISNIYHLNAGYTPLHSYCPLSLAIRKMPVDNVSKYYIKCGSGKRAYPVGGIYEDGWMKAKVRSFGTYSVELDTLPPSVVPIDTKMWRSRPEKIRFAVKDDGSGLNTYKVYIDGQFVLFWLKRGQLIIQTPKKIKRDVAHHLEVIVTDGCRNETRKQINF